MRRSFLGFLIAPAAAVAQAAPPLAEVPFTLHQNAVIVEAVVNGRDTVRLLLDTGWGPLALVESAARRLGLTAEPAGADRIARAGSLGIGGAATSNVTFELFPDESLQPLIGPHDGVLSTAFFRDLVLQVDYPHGVVRFFARSPLSGEPAIPMIFVPGAGALPFSDSVFVDGRPVRALFDTGGSGGFMVMPRLVERAGLEVLPDTGPRLGVGMFGDGRPVRAALRFARVGRIAVGVITRESPRVLIAPTELTGAEWNHDLIVGYGFFRDLVVTFDYPGRLIHFTR